MAQHKRKDFNKIRLVTNDYMQKHYKEDIVNIDDKLIENDLIKECKNE